MFTTQLLHLDVEIREAQRRRALAKRSLPLAVEEKMRRRNHHHPSVTRRVTTTMQRHLGALLINLGQRLTQRHAVTQGHEAAPR